MEQLFSMLLLCPKELILRVHDVKEAEAKLEYIKTKKINNEIL
jgi:hypothetical protein